MNGRTFTQALLVLTLVSARPSAWATPPDGSHNFRGEASSTNSILWSWEKDVAAGYAVLMDGPSRRLVSQTQSDYYNESGLKANSAVTRLVRVGDANGLSDASQLVRVYTLAAAPRRLRAVIVKARSVQLEWDDAGNSDETLYRIQRSDDGTNFLDVTKPVTQLTYTDTDLEPGTKYRYRIKAINGDGIATPYSPSLVVVTKHKLDFDRPSRPLGVRGGLDFSGKVFTLIWEPVDSTANGRSLSKKGYHVYRRDKLGGPPVRLTREPLRVTVFADVVENRTYYYTVRAVDRTDNESDESLFVDSSENQNIIYASKDALTSVVIPADLNTMMLPHGNKYGVALDLRVREEESDQAYSVLRSVHFELVRGDTRDTVNDLPFAMAKAIVKVGLSPQDAAKVARLDQLALHWHNGKNWVRVGGTVNTKEKEVAVQTGYLGHFQLRVAPQPGPLLLTDAEGYPIVGRPGQQRRLFLNGDGSNSAPVPRSVFDNKRKKPRDTVATAR